MTRKKKVIRCDVCGTKATRYIGVATLPICQNDVCFHTRIKEVNAEIEQLKYKEAEVTNTCHE